MEHWILKMKVKWGEIIALEMETMWHFLCSCFAVSNGGKFKSIYLKFHPFQLPREHLQPLFCSNRKLKLGKPTSKHGLKPDITHLLSTNNMYLTAL